MVDALILTDCGPRIGLGHLQRCLVLAGALARRNVNLRLLIPDTIGRSLAEGAGFVAGPWPRDLCDLPSADIVVIDSYEIDAELCRNWRGRFKVRLVIDDLADRPLDTDMILNPNLHSPELNYSENRDSLILAGLTYCLVDPLFVALQDQSRSRPPRVVVAFGGSDDGRRGTSVAERLLASTDARIDLVVSPMHAPSPETLTLAGERPGRLVLHHGSRMVEVMDGASLYVGACGSTVWEASAAGLSLVVARIADNQARIQTALAARGVYAFERFDEKRMAAAAKHWLTTLEPNPLSSQIDGRGAARCAEAILRLGQFSGSVT